MALYGRLSHWQTEVNLGYYLFALTLTFGPSNSREYQVSSV